MTTTKHALEDGISQRVHDAADQLVDLKDAVGKQLERRASSLAALVEAHPLVAIGVALGAGYLIARILHRRS